MDTVYADIAARTGGNIYIGVVGPVRTGKSTMIKRIMEQLVIPAIDDPYLRERARDELPQSGSGKTIMTSEPKFVPEEAVEISPDGMTTLRIRMIDSVGYMVDGAVGADEDGQPRMVTTPWFDYEIPMTEAAQLGTQKVMQEHCSIGLVVTTDGTITEIPRADYIAAEARAIADMKQTGKPFAVVVNSRNPAGEEALTVVDYLRHHFGVEPIAIDAQSLDTDGIAALVQQLLLAFPMRELHVHMPGWVHALDREHPVKASLYEALLKRAEQISSLAQAGTSLAELRELEQVLDFSVRRIIPSTGTVVCSLTFPEALFYEILSSKTGMAIENDGQLLTLLTELSAVKREYDKIADALAAANATGYGIVMPNAQEMSLQPPELLRKNGACGIKLQASAPSIHMIRVDVETEVSPIIGSEQQANDFVDYLLKDPESMWDTDIFGKPLSDIVTDSLKNKIQNIPDNARDKLQNTLERVVNEGDGGMLFILL